MALTQATILEQVQEIRSKSEVFLNSTGTLRHKTGETVVRGEPVYTYSTSEIQLRIIVRSGDDRTNIAAQFRQPHLTSYTGIYKMQLAFDTTVSEGDLIDFIDIVNSEQRTVEVVFAPPKHDMMGAFVITVKEVT